VPAANAHGWNNTDVTATFACSDLLSGVDVGPVTPQMLSAEGAGQSRSATCTDKAGNSASLTVNTINIDKTAPSAAAAASPPANANGWNNGNVMVSFTGSDLLSGLDSCSAPVTLSGEGAGQSASGTCTDKAGNSRAASATGINIDKTAPALTGARAPAANANGWNNTDVTATFACVDPLSGVDAGPLTPQVVSADGAGQSRSATCTDKAGNAASATVNTINIDKTAPSATATPAPAPNANGWNNTNVTVSFSGTDGGSGIDTCSAAATLSGEGAGQSASGSCTDKAGNAAAATASGINIDKTAPTASAAAAPSPNANGWNNSAVTVSFACSDTLSGLATGSPPADAILAGDGANQSAAGTCTDKAGNNAAALATGINIDKTGPAPTGSRSPAANAHGWNNTDVTATFACSDLLSGVDAGPLTPQVVSAEGAGQSRSATCTDKAGNSASATVNTINIDKTAPSASATPAPAPNANGWNNTNVTVSFSGADPLSGIDACSAAATLSGEAAGQSASGSCADKAGNSASATASGINIDKTAPGIAFGAATPAANGAGWNNTNVSVPFTATDALSGMDITTPGASPLVLMTEGAAVTGSVSATDRAGNTRTVSSAAFKIDKTPPAVSAAASPGPNGAGWNNTNVTVSFTALDGLSGVAAVTAPVTVTSEGSGQVVTGTALDAAGNTGAASATLNIDKTPPVVSNVMANRNPAQINEATEITATATNPTPLGAPIVSAEVQIEGGPFQLMSAADGAFDNELTEGVTNSPTMTSSPTPGVVTDCVRATDAAGNVSAAECTLQAVYDPEAGFVTGGGWIQSPAGAYLANGGLTGKANFGFVSKYLRGANTPTGQTEFQFKVGNLNFHSSTYDWLVVAGAKAQYKGTGTINGSGEFGFLLTATDGQLPGGGGVDRFRIKIWDKGSGTVVYDNKVGMPDDPDLFDPQEIGGGSIVIHTR